MRLIVAHTTLYLQRQHNYKVHGLDIYSESIGRGIFYNERKSISRNQKRGFHRPVSWVQIIHLNMPVSKIFLKTLLHTYTSRNASYSRSHQLTVKTINNDEANDWETGRPNRSMGQSTSFIGQHLQPIGHLIRKAV